MMKNYIVRTYRDEKEHPRSLIGIVETAGLEGKKSFTNIEELWDILNPRKKAVRRRKNVRGPAGK